MYTTFVYTIHVKNITLSADEHLIEQARTVARAQHRTLNEAFREWLHEFVGKPGEAKKFDAVMKSLRHVNAGRKFTREELNER